MDDCISRQAAIEIVDYECGGQLIGTAKIITTRLSDLPPAQPEYEPVTAEDFAKTMSENTIYSFMAWHQEALTLMKEQGFVICKKTM